MLLTPSLCGCRWKPLQLLRCNAPLFACLTDETPAQSLPHRRRECTPYTLLRMKVLREKRRVLANARLIFHLAPTAAGVFSYTEEGVVAIHRSCFIPRSMLSSLESLFGSTEENSLEQQSPRLRLRFGSLRSRNGKLDALVVLCGPWPVRVFITVHPTPAAAGHVL